MRHALLLITLAACAPASVSAPLDAGAGDAGSALGDALAPRPDAVALGDSGPSPDLAAPQADAPTQRDAPPLAPDGGPALGEPPWVDVDVRTGAGCDPVRACGGEVEGTWDVAAACIEVPLDEALMRCPGAAVTRRGGRARGRVVFASRVARRVAEWTAEVEANIPAVCALVLGGCSGIQSAVRPAAPDTTCETRSNGDCRCTSRQSGRIDDADGYTTERGQIVSATLGRRWDYCVQGELLRYRDVSGAGPREPGVITLRRR